MPLRLGLDVPDIINVYKEDDVKISVVNHKIEICYESAIKLRKRHKEVLTIKYRNLTSENINIYSIMENTRDILRIGKSSADMNLGPKETKSVSFQILAIKSGYCEYPLVRSYLDGN
jgi:hypothetical protein